MFRKFAQFIFSSSPRTLPENDWIRNSEYRSHRVFQHFGTFEQFRQDSCSD